MTFAGCHLRFFGAESASRHAARRSPCRTLQSSLAALQLVENALRLGSAVRTKISLAPVSDRIHRFQRDRTLRSGK
jgi:hypothetical protein